MIYTEALRPPFRIAESSPGFYRIVDARELAVTTALPLEDTNRLYDAILRVDPPGTHYEPPPDMVRAVVQRCRENPVTAFPLDVELYLRRAINQYERRGER